MEITQLEELIRWGGYALLVGIVFAETGLLAGFFLPGDSLLVTAGLMASQGFLSIGWLILLLSGAAIAGDSTGYALGFHWGPRLFRKEDSRFFHRKHLLRAQEFYQRHGVKTIVLSRFVPIVRTFAPTLAGVGKMSYRTFLVYNVAGGIGWVASMTLTGFFLGRLVPDIERYLHWVIAVVIAVSFLPLLWERRKMKTARIVLALLLWSGAGIAVAAGQAPARTAKAQIVNREGKPVGEALLTEEAPGQGVQIRLQVTGFVPGTHAFHIHAVGKCDGPDFKSAGPHFNPHGKKHGKKNPEGAHAGDLPNLVVGPDGSGSLETVAAEVTLGEGPESLLDADGAALVIHAKPDDDVTDPAGNAGDRIACGVVTR